MIVVIVILFTTKQFTPYTNPTVAKQLFLTSYNVPSPWTTATPVQGDSGMCAVYTFTGECNPSTPCNRPPMINLATIDEKINAGYVSKPDLSATCSDSDQVFMQKVQHICLYGKVGKTGPQTVGCVKQDSTYAAAGEIEEFWQLCQPGNGSGSITGQTQTSTANQGICKGSISGVGFGYSGVPASAPVPSAPYCLKAPSYAVDTKGNPAPTTSVLSFQSCDLSSRDVNNYPDQLFRVERAFYSQGKFQPGNGGYFARIIHRPSGACVAPSFEINNTVVDITKPTLGSPLQLVSCNLSTTLTGYWWMIAPSITPTIANPVTLGKDTTINPPAPGWGFAPKSFPQLVYVPDPTKISPNLSPDVLWKFLTNEINPIYSVCLNSATAPTDLKLSNYMIYDSGLPIDTRDGSNSVPADYTTGTVNIGGVNTKYTQSYFDLTTKDKAQGCSFQYYDYAIYNLIVDEPEVFNF